MTGEALSTEAVMKLALPMLGFVVARHRHLRPTGTSSNKFFTWVAMAAITDPFALRASRQSEVPSPRFV